MFRVNERVRAYVQDVLKESKGPQIILSRACTEFLIKLFEQEVPEIYEGIVRDRGRAREPGARSKIAVVSNDRTSIRSARASACAARACRPSCRSCAARRSTSCRGAMTRCATWSRALAPAQVVRIMVDDEKRSMDVIVPDDQLSLAIGKKGQNVRLAVQLTRWKIDIKSETLHARGAGGSRAGALGRRGRR